MEIRSKQSEIIQPVSGRPDLNMFSIVVPLLAQRQDPKCRDSRPRLPDVEQRVRNT